MIRMCPSAREKSTALRQDEADDFSYAELSLLELDKMDTEKDDCSKSFIWQKKNEIEKSSRLLKKMLCKSEELDRYLDQQKREFNQNLEQMKEIFRLLKEADEFLADHEGGERVSC